MQGYPCEGSGEEVKTCNEKKCPGRGQPCQGWAGRSEVPALPKGLLNPDSTPCVHLSV